MQIFLEIFFTKIVKTNLIYSKVSFEITSLNLDPSEIVLEVISKNVKGVPIFKNNNFLSHSTSWRYEKSKIILTYIIYSDFADFDPKVTNTLPITEFEILKTNDAKNPSISGLSDKNILSHAVRHLAFLLNHGEGDLYRNCINKENQQIFSTLHQSLAGDLN